MAPDSPAVLMARLAAAVRGVDTGSVHETLQQMVDLAVEVVPGCDRAAVAIVQGKTTAASAATDAVARRFVALQVELGEGPSMDAAVEAELVQSDDLSAESRWPRFAPAALQETGFASVLAVRLFTRGKTLGGLNLLATRRAAFTDDDVAVAALYAAVAAVALNAAAVEEGLQVALGSRDVIGRAKGILMERHKITDEDAFRRLTEVSQRMNIRLVKIAEQIARTGEEGAVPPP